MAGRAELTIHFFTQSNVISVRNNENTLCSMHEMCPTVNGFASPNSHSKN
jgi:hypothetical protein